MLMKRGVTLIFLMSVFSLNSDCMETHLKLLFFLLSFHQLLNVYMGITHTKGRGGGWAFFRVDGGEGYSPYHIFSSPLLSQAQDFLAF